METWVKSLRGNNTIEIIVDDDYNIRKTINGTDKFIENFLRQIGLRATGKQIAVLDTKRRDNKLRATIKLPFGQIIEFYASKSSIKESREIQIMDIIMGYYLDNNDGFEKDKLFFRKI